MKIHKNFGFTLIELMVVIVIIGILVAIALPNFVASQNRAKVASTKSNAKTLQTIVETYNIDYGSYPSSISAITTHSSYKEFKNPFTGFEGASDTTGKGAWRTNNDGASGSPISAYSDSAISKGLVLYVGLDSLGVNNTMFLNNDGVKAPNLISTNYLIYICGEDGYPVRKFLLSPGEIPNDAKDLL